LKINDDREISAAAMQPIICRRIKMKKIIFLSVFAAVCGCLVSCDKKNVYPLERVEIWEGSRIVAGLKDVHVGETYVFTAKFFNTKSQEVQPENPANVIWSSDDASSPYVVFTPSTGTFTSYVLISSQPVGTVGKIKVEYENLTPRTINTQFKN
jgi:hypothetical protein